MNESSIPSLNRVLKCVILLNQWMIVWTVRVDVEAHIGVSPEPHSPGSRCVEFIWVNGKTAKVLNRMRTI